LGCKKTDTLIICFAQRWPAAHVIAGLVGWAWDLGAENRTLELTVQKNGYTYHRRLLCPFPYLVGWLFSDYSLVRGSGRSRKAEATLPNYTAAYSTGSYHGPHVGLVHVCLNLMRVAVEVLMLALANTIKYLTIPYKNA
jgi:hypothetical protein